MGDEPSMSSCPPGCVGEVGRLGLGVVGLVASSVGIAWVGRDVNVNAVVSERMKE